MVAKRGRAHEEYAEGGERGRAPSLLSYLWPDMPYLPYVSGRFSGLVRVFFSP